MCCFFNSLYGVWKCSETWSSVFNILLTYVEGEYIKSFITTTCCSLTLVFSYFQSHDQLEGVPFIGICREPHVASQVRQIRKPYCSEDQISHCFATFSLCAYCTHVYFMLSETVIFLTQSILLLTVQRKGNFVRCSWSQLALTTIWASITRAYSQGMVFQFVLTL